MAAVAGGQVLQQAVESQAGTTVRSSKLLCSPNQP